MTTALAYFDEHPEAREDVLKAWYAYHDGFAPGSEPPTPADTARDRRHSFVDRSGASGREARCALCGRSRETVRWDSLPARCAERVSTRMTASTVRAEEEAFFSLLARSPRLVAKHVPNPNALTGERLQWLQSTHGIEPDTVEAVLGIQIPSAVIETYLMAMDAHREASRAS